MKIAISDRPYLEWLKTQQCLLTGQHASDYDAVDPMHIGTHGKGIKTDDEAIPVLHSLHSKGHNGGEISMLRQHAPNWLLREAFRAYARQMYAEYLAEHRKSA